MSSLARWSYTDWLTVWPLTGNSKSGSPTFGPPYLIKGSWATGGDTSTDASGAEFVTKSKYFFEHDDQLEYHMPKRGDYILRKDNRQLIDPIQAEAELIRRIDGNSASMFGSHEWPDFVALTGNANR